MGLFSINEQLGNAELHNERLGRSVNITNVVLRHAKEYLSNDSANDSAAGLQRRWDDMVDAVNKWTRQWGTCFPTFPVKGGLEHILIKQTHDRLAAPKGRDMKCIMRFLSIMADGMLKHLAAEAEDEDEEEEDERADRRRELCDLIDSYNKYMELSRRDAPTAAQVRETQAAARKVLSAAAPVAHLDPTGFEKWKWHQANHNHTLFLGKGGGDEATEAQHSESTKIFREQTSKKADTSIHSICNVLDAELAMRMVQQNELLRWASRSCAPHPRTRW